MPEAITLTVRPDLPSADAERSLASWLRADDRLRDGVTLTPDEAGGGGADVLRVAVDAGAAMILVQAVAAWLTHRRDDMAVQLDRADGWSADMDVHQARDMDQVTALIAEAVRAVTPG